MLRAVCVEVGVVHTKFGNIFSSCTLVLQQYQYYRTIPINGANSNIVHCARYLYVKPVLSTQHQHTQCPS